MNRFEQAVVRFACGGGYETSLRGKRLQSVSGAAVPQSSRASKHIKRDLDTKGSA